jgi:hypothetical protein
MDTVLVLEVLVLAVMVRVVALVWDTARLVDTVPVADGVFVEAAVEDPQELWVDVLDVLTEEV